MPETGSSLLDGIKIVPEAGKRVQLPTLPASVPNSANTVLVQALSTNEGEIVVGASTVVAAKGSHATPTRRGAALAAGANLSLQVNDPSQVWLDVEKAGDGVSYLVLVQ